MTNVIKFFGVICLSLLLIHSSYHPANALSNELEASATNIRKIDNYMVIYENRVAPPPATYYYSDKIGWKGTLYLTSWQSTGTEIIALYSGTVSCSGTCQGFDSTKNN